MRLGEEMGIRLKFWFFCNYWWLLILVFLGIGMGMVLLWPSVDFKLLGMLLGTFLSLLYFLQKQRLEEMRLFREIFAECNGRYDKMNERLKDIVDAPGNQKLQSEELAILYDYFNLCGEEYLYYRQGFIFPSVWTAWHNGMKYNFTNPRIAAVWTAEKESESYYGLPL
ncbi:MAG TPA: hypothetical protein PKJ63_13290 [Cyclobacteriaceae bacterium]|nr:hypothetical protein [Cyclobacteriaceae bacterium]